MNAFVLLAKGLNGGVIVTVFAVFGHVAKPKRFAGIFSAAPTVALANLSVLVIASGTSDMRSYAAGMLVGTAAFATHALSCQVILDRLGSIVGSLVSFGLWFAVAVPGYWIFLR